MDISYRWSTSHEIHIYDGTGPIARLRRAEEAIIEQTLQEMARGAERHYRQAFDLNASPGKVWGRWWWRGRS